MSMDADALAADLGRWSDTRHDRHSGRLRCHGPRNGRARAYARERPLQSRVVRLSITDGSKESKDGIRSACGRRGIIGSWFRAGSLGVISPPTAVFANARSRLRRCSMRCRGKSTVPSDGVAADQRRMEAARRIGGACSPLNVAGGIRLRRAIHGRGDAHYPLD